MNFEFSEDQQQLKDQARRFLADKADSKAVRKILDGEAPFDEGLWKGIVELGWTGAAIPESYGGLGLGYLELCVIAEELGRALAPTPFASSVYLFAEALLQAGSEEQKQKYLPMIVSGEAIGAFAVSERSGLLAPKAIHTKAQGGKLTGEKAPVLDGLAASHAIVAAKTASGNDPRSVSLFVVDLNAKGVTREYVETIDPTRKQAVVTLDEVEAEPLGGAGEGMAIIEKVFDRAAVMIAFEQLGASQAALEMGCAYAKDRYAFGRQIGSFQAIKHMLADMYVATELARSNCYYGAWALSTDAPELPEAAATARVSATEASQLTGKNVIQVHGGMGFTWEFDCHLYYRRAKLLATAIGGQKRWKNLLVTRLEARNAA